jgi:hypothetical protein
MGRGYRFGFTSTDEPPPSLSVTIPQAVRFDVTAIRCHRPPEGGPASAVRRHHPHDLISDIGRRRLPIVLRILDFPSLEKVDRYLQLIRELNLKLVKGDRTGNSVRAVLERLGDSWWECPKCGKRCRFIYFGAFVTDIARSYNVSYSTGRL